ncbi:MAG: Rrf2 family transcriptional regulator [Acidimicrobiia bacterium]
MKVALGRKGDYSVRAVLDIAKNRGAGRRKAREIAASMEIPDRYLTQILAHLVSEGLLNAVAGPDGGYSLARSPEAITLLEVVEAAEGRILLDECVLRGGPCEWDEVCPVHTPWVRAQNALVAELSKTTLADLVGVAAEIDAGAFELPDDTPLHAVRTPRGTRDRGAP